MMNSLILWHVYDNSYGVKVRFLLFLLKMAPSRFIELLYFFISVVALDKDCAVLDLLLLPLKFIFFSN